MQFKNDLWQASVTESSDTSSPPSRTHYYESSSEHGIEVIHAVFSDGSYVTIKRTITQKDIEDEKILGKLKKLWPLSVFNEIKKKQEKK